MSLPFAFFLPSLGPPEMMIVGIVAVLLFGKRLPEVGRSIGKGIVEFKKGLRGIEDEFISSSSSSNVPARTETYRASDEAVTSVPKFEPPTTAPTPRNEYEPQAYQD